MVQANNLIKKRLEKMKKGLEFTDLETDTDRFGQKFITDQFNFLTYFYF